MAIFQGAAMGFGPHTVNQTGAAAMIVELLLKPKWWTTKNKEQALMMYSQIVTQLFETWKLNVWLQRPIKLRFAQLIAYF